MRTHHQRSCEKNEQSSDMIVVMSIISISELRRVHNSMWCSNAESRELLQSKLSVAALFQGPTRPLPQLLNFKPGGLDDFQSAPARTCPKLCERTISVRARKMSSHPT